MQIATPAETAAVTIFEACFGIESVCHVKEQNMPDMRTANYLILCQW